MDNESRRQQYLRRDQELRNERASHDAKWRDIARHVQPHRERFLVSGRNRGERKDQNIINNGPWRASDINAAGMQAGITSPTRPWWRTTTKDKELGDLESVKDWCNRLDERLRAILAGSNVYLKFHEMYVDLGGFGVSPMLIEEDVQRLIRATVYPVGSYALAANAAGKVDTLFHRVSMTVRQCIEEFGAENCSERILNANQRRRFDEWIELLHVIEPNPEYVQGRLGPEGMTYRSCWLDVGGNEADGFLREQGYHECPFIAPRWSTTGEDVYGSGYPGEMSLGDCKTLQQLERRGLQVLDKISDPPMVGPSSMRDEPVDLMPGGINYEDPASQGRGFRPALELSPQALPAVGNEVARVELRINKTWKVDLWLMLANDETTGGRMTATEVVERKSEKVLQLGPMLERFHDEGLIPFFERVFSVALRYGEIPEPPAEMQGQELKVEFVSILAQAQKMVGIQGIRELASFGGQLAAAHPDVLDKLDLDQMMDTYGEMLGTPPGLVRSDDQVQALRAQRAQQAAQAAQMQQVQAAAQSAKTLSQADTEGDNALTRMLDATGPGGR
jgi:hypothetical protein